MKNRKNTLLHILTAAFFLMSKQVEADLCREVVKHTDVAFVVKNDDNTYVEPRVTAIVEGCRYHPGEGVVEFLRKKISKTTKKELENNPLKCMTGVTTQFNLEFSQNNKVVYGAVLGCSPTLEEILFGNDRGLAKLGATLKFRYINYQEPMLGI